MKRQLSTQTISVAELSFQLQAFQDPEREFIEYFENDERTNLPEPPLHGCIWPAAEGLAQYLWQHRLQLMGKKILELGCGLALPALVCARAGAEVLAIDHQAEAGFLLGCNCKLNGIAGVSFQTVSFTNPNVKLGSFQFIIASDILYDPKHYPMLEDFIMRHAASEAEILIADPGRYAARSFGAGLKKAARYQLLLQKLNQQSQPIEIHSFRMHPCA